jgi:hypothetical protein
MECSHALLHCRPLQTCSPPILVPSAPIYAVVPQPPSLEPLPRHKLSLREENVKGEEEPWRHELNRGTKELCYRVLSGG